ncbi:MAG: hypothetical protein QXS19_09085, partial [Candidatus Methanomethylicia archaeon]
MSSFDVNFILKDISNAFPNRILDYRFDGPRSVFMSVDPSALHDVIKYLKDKYDLRHIVTITG